MPVTLNKRVPAFKAPATSETEVKSSELKGSPYVIYFYPKDNTPGCTQDGQDFRDLYPKFKKLGVQVFGVSRDSLRAHENFRKKFEFPFELIADPEETLCTLFDVIRMKNMYGKQVRGIERSTFLVDEKGILRREWRKVKVPDHAAEVLAAAGELS